MKTDEFITYLRKEHQIIISVHGEELKIKAPKESLTGEIVSQIKERKPAILEFFRTVKLKSRTAVIERVARRDHYKLSSAQLRLYFLQQFDEHSLAYNVPQVFTLTGHLDKTRLEWVFQQLVQRHESLRTTFEWHDGEPAQKILAGVDFKIEHFVCGETESQELIDRFVRPFQLSKAPLIRVGLAVLAEDRHLLLVDMHHIITDGVAVNILSNDFMALYKGEELPPLHLQYKDYAEWQQAAAGTAERDRHRAYWLSRFATPPNTPELPVDFQRPMVKSFAGNSIEFYLDPVTTRHLKTLADRQEATLFMVLLTIFNILISKLSAQEDIVVGIPVAGRNHPDLEGIIGMFVNTLPLRNEVDGALTFSAFLSAVKSNMLAALDHQSYPYEDLVDQLKLERETGRNPLFDVMFTYQNFEKTALVIPGLTLEPWYKNRSIAKFDITLTAFELADQVLLNLEYATALFKQSTIERMAAYFQRIVALVVANPALTLSSIDMINPAERRQLVYGYNDTAVAPAGEATVTDRFRQQVLLYPDHTALQCRGVKLSYRELDELSDIMAYYLQVEKNVQPGDLVGIMPERDLYLVPCLLAIWKAGAAYVPVDPGYPRERIQTILQEAPLKLLIVHDRYMHDLEGAGAHTAIESVEKVLQAVGTDSRGPLPVNKDIHALAYIIFTSGSTGKPKGVMVSHHALHNYISWAAGQYAQGDEAGFALYTSVAFDLTVTSLFVPLVTGNTIFIYPEKEHGLLIEEVILADEASVVKLTPAHLKVMADSKNLRRHIPKRLQCLIVGGDQLDTALARSIHEQYEGRVVIYNEYGPTEATVGCMIHRFDPAGQWAAVPIGLPIQNTRVYILDKYLAPAATGVEGELFIAGHGVAEGYYKQDALTREKFIPDPFVPGTSMYRTGDRGVRLDDGNILYKGRTDEQVKIRGFRVEPEEIAGRLKLLTGIEEAIVIVKEKEDDKYLVAYYVAATEQDTALLHGWVTAALPAYMAPAFFVHLAALPLTINGKLDKKALPDPVIKVGQDHVSANGVMEKELVEIWGLVLGISKEAISVRKSFFELGGNSLKILKLHALINERLPVTVTIPALFRYPTITSLAAFLQKEQPDDNTSHLLIQAELAGMQRLLGSLG